MGSFLLRLLGRRAAHKVIATQQREGGALDAKFGLALMRDRRVPVRFKLLALGIGVGLIAVLIALEIPLETALGVLLPLVGFIPDAIVDGLEILIGPLLVSALLLPHLAPKALVAEIRAERMGLGTGPIIAVENAAPVYAAPVVSPIEAERIQTVSSRS